MLFGEWFLSTELINKKGNILFHILKITFSQGQFVELVSSLGR